MQAATPQTLPLVIQALAGLVGLDPLHDFVECVRHVFTLQMHEAYGVFRHCREASNGR